MADAVCIEKRDDAATDCHSDRISSSPCIRPSGSDIFTGKVREAAAYLLTRISNTIMNAAAKRGRKGGLATAERGPEYFKRIAAMRKTKGGGRPRKQAENAD
jgi:hypothetical protein